MPYPHILSPLRIKRLSPPSLKLRRAPKPWRRSLRNRIVMPPMVTNMLRNGVSDQALAWYAERAKGGVGLVIVEAVWVDRFSDERFARQLRSLSQRIHEAGAPAAIQLFKRPTVAGKPVSISGEAGLRQITTEELAAIPGEFAAAAKAAQNAGFDGAEIHGAHGFFLNQFFSPKTNKRTDAYGGSLEGRSCLGLESAKAARQAVGDDFLLFYRHTPEQGAPDGYTLSDSIAFCQKLVAAGIDVLDISPSTRHGSAHAGLAGAIKKAVSAPVIAVGGMNDPTAAEAALSNGSCDLCAIGRGLIADAHWVEKVKAGKEADIHCCPR